MLIFLMVDIRQLQLINYGSAQGRDGIGHPGKQGATDQKPAN